MSNLVPIEVHLSGISQLNFITSIVAPMTHHARLLLDPVASYLSPTFTSVCFHNSREQADIDRTEIANATFILNEHLRKQNYDTNARPGEGSGKDIGHSCVTLHS